jgi:hypothetical protein
MNCRHSEHELALYVEGDLPPDKVSEVDVHLVSCVLCRELVEELRETQSVFKSMKQEAVSPQALAHLRTRVLGEVAARNLRCGWGRWVYALAGVGIVLAVSVGVVTRNPHRGAKVVSDPLPPLAALPLYQGESGGVDSARLTLPLAKGESREAAGGRSYTLLKNGKAKTKLMTRHEPQIPSGPPKEITVKLLTDDPNVVIYWLVEQNGGTF